jgi:hypothetical protein
MGIQNAEWCYELFIDPRESDYLIPGLELFASRGAGILAPEAGKNAYPTTRIVQRHLKRCKASAKAATA